MVFIDLDKTYESVFNSVGAPRDIDETKYFVYRNRITLGFSLMSLFNHELETYKSPCIPYCKPFFCN